MQSTSVIVSLPETVVPPPARKVRTRNAPLFYAFLGSIAIHLGTLAVFQLFPQRTAVSATDLDARARGVQLVATIRLGIVDAVSNDANETLPAAPFPPTPPEPKSVTPPEAQPQQVAKTEPPAVPVTSAPAPTRAVNQSPAPTTAATPVSPPTGSGSSSSEFASRGDLGTSRAQDNGGAFTAARADYLHNPPPRYPTVARQKGWQGVTVLRVQVRADGAADCVEVLKTSGHRLLDKVSIETVRGWKFSPARLGDSAVTSWVEVPIRFQLVSS